MGASLLFEEKHRTRLGPMRQGESDYSFYDECARPGYDAYRALLNSWLAAMPETDGAELVARFRGGDAQQYRAALAELVIHETLRRRGYEIDIHPTVAHPTRRPDFLAKTKAGEPLALVEVTTFGLAQEDVAKSNREAAIHNAVNSAELPKGYRLTYGVDTYGTGSPSVGKLQQEISAWAHEYAKSGKIELIERVFEALDWRLDIGLIGGFKESSDGRMIVAAMGEARWVAAGMEVRYALEKKGKRYGTNELPFVIVVADCKGELTGGESNDEEFLEALYGTVAYTISTDPAEEPRIVGVSRKSNGYWGTPDAPKNSQVSGVVLLPQPDLWSLRNPRWQPLLARNRRATFAIADDFLPLPGFRLTDDNRFVREEGNSLADMLDLPKEWPPTDA